MGLDRSGAQQTSRARTGVTANDSAWPATTDGAAVPANAKGSITHVTVAATGTGTGVALRVDILGLLGDTWYTLAQLNSGSNITRTTQVNTANGNNIQYAESFSHISFYDRLYPLVSNVAGGVSANIDFRFERL